MKTISILIRPPISIHPHGSPWLPMPHSPASGGIVPEVMQSSTNSMDVFLIFSPSPRLLRPGGQEPINWDFDWLRLAFTKISRNLVASSISTGPLTLRTHYLSDNALGTCLEPNLTHNPLATEAERGVPQL
jgi:hypothetical protein